VAANNNNNLSWQPSGSPNFDRWGLQASQAVNDAWKAIRSMPVFPVYSTVNRPTASPAWVNRLIVVRDSGSDDVLQWCRQLAAGGYEWKVVAY